jgi:hypothetical protein
MHSITVVYFWFLSIEPIVEHHYFVGPSGRFSKNCHGSQRYLMLLRAQIAKPCSYCILGPVIAVQDSAAPCAVGCNSTGGMGVVIDRSAEVSALHAKALR